MYSALYTLPYIEVLSVVSMFVANKEIRLRLQVDLNGNSSALKSLKELLIPAWALLLARVRKPPLRFGLMVQAGEKTCESPSCYLKVKSTPTSERVQPEINASSGQHRWLTGNTPTSQHRAPLIKTPARGTKSRILSRKPY